jgi:hypothetical protein
MTAGWMPVSPCEDCDIERQHERNHMYGFNNECLCGDMYEYQHIKDAIKRLMEYLLSKNSIGAVTYKEIVSKLEESSKNE